jgi:hypothetical protein
LHPIRQRLGDLAGQRRLSNTGLASHDDAGGTGLPNKGSANCRELGLAVYHRPILGTHQS